MRVAITGAHGVGKTTLTTEVVRSLKAIGIVTLNTPEVPREICETVGDPEFLRRGRNSIAKQLSILLGQVTTERILEHADRSQVVLCDRGVIDHWAYTKAQFGSELEQQQLLPVVDRYVREYMLTYDLVAYVPIEFAPVDDGVREGDVEFQQLIDSEIQTLLDSYGITPIQLSGPVVDRVAMLVAAISRTLQSQESG